MSDVRVIARNGGTETDITEGMGFAWGRRGGKTTATRRGMEAAATAGKHVHYATRDGSWCLTRQPAGFLYVHLPRP